MSINWFGPQTAPQPYHPYGHQPFTGQPNWQGGQPPWLAALLAAHQAAQPQVPAIPSTSPLPPGLVGNTHVPFLQPGGAGYPGNYQGNYPGFGGGQGGFGHLMPPTTDGRVGV